MAKVMQFQSNPHNVIQSKQSIHLLVVATETSENIEKNAKWKQRTPLTICRASQTVDWNALYTCSCSYSAPLQRRPSWKRKQFASTSLKFTWLQTNGHFQDNTNTWQFINSFTWFKSANSTKNLALFALEEIRPILIYWLSFYLFIFAAQTKS